jgi:hypothetical protein
MNSKYIAYIILAIFAIFGWNWFLIQRDNKMFEKYYEHRVTEKIDV